MQGSGRKGRITKEDVEAAKAGPAPAKAAPAKAAPAADGAGLGLAPWPKVDFEKFGPVERKALSRIKKISGPALHRNWVMIPHVTHQDEADITELEAFRKRTNEEYAKRGVKLTMVALLLKACVASLKQFPEFNASLTATSWCSSATTTWASRPTRRRAWSCRSSATSTRRA